MSGPRRQQWQLTNMCDLIEEGRGQAGAGVEGEEMAKGSCLRRSLHRGEHGFKQQPGPFCRLGRRLHVRPDWHRIDQRQAFNFLNCLIQVDTLKHESIVPPHLTEGIRKSTLSVIQNQSSHELGTPLHAYSNISNPPDTNKSLSRAYPRNSIRLRVFHL